MITTKGGKMRKNNDNIDSFHLTKFILKKKIEIVSFWGMGGESEKTAEGSFLFY